ncbi:unnamed protein product, partial [Ectocarpus fasciculatus]
MRRAVSGKTSCMPRAALAVLLGSYAVTNSSVIGYGGCTLSIVQRVPSTAPILRSRLLCRARLKTDATLSCSTAPTDGCCVDPADDASAGVGRDAGDSLEFGLTNEGLFNASHGTPSGDAVREDVIDLTRSAAAPTCSVFEIARMAVRKRRRERRERGHRASDSQGSALLGPRGIPSGGAVREDVIGDLARSAAAPSVFEVARMAVRKRRREQRERGHRA